MCGITGFIDFSKSSGRDSLKSMADALYHRGPDDSGEELFELPQANIGFGFRRLAIIDLSPLGHQPMQNSSNGNWIVFNGEIYNFNEIKTELIELGYSFKSNSDTEVILKSYQHWGNECVDQFIGMFAIVLYDNVKNKVICFRDRVGVKPFYYCTQDNLFLFGSELKSFHRHPKFEKEIDKNALASFFQHGYIPGPSSIFKNVYKLRPGHLMEIDLLTQAIQIKKYWSIDHSAISSLNIDYESAKEELEKLLISSFNYRLVADVPVGVFLSGGYDSSCVAAILQKSNSSTIKTYTIGFDEPGYNEAQYAKEVAKYIGTDHSEFYCTFSDAQSIIPHLADIYDEPFGDSSAIPTTLVSKIAREHVTVALSADGGDELFAGYPRHSKSLRQISKINAFPSILKKIGSSIINSKVDTLVSTDRKNKLKSALLNGVIEGQFEIINQTFTDEELNILFNSSVSKINSAFNEKLIGDNVDNLVKILALEFKTYLPDDILQKVDRASMSVSLEGREPFLDHRLAEFVFKLPSEFKLNNGTQKRILKDIVHKYIPKEIMERPKMGFGVPVNVWCKSELLDLFMSHMSDEALAISGLLNVNAVKEIRNKYLEGSLENFERIWFIFIFQQWYSRWM